LASILSTSFCAAAARRSSGSKIHVQRQHVPGLRVAALALGIGIVDPAKGRWAVVRAGHKAIARTNCFWNAARIFSNSRAYFSSSCVRAVACAICSISVASYAQ
jgi:hypothetical protein